MNNLASVTIDAGVLAVPCSSCSEDEVYKYIDTLADWAQLLGDQHFAIHMSEKASEVLVAEGCYPLRNQLDLLFSSHGIVDQDTNTFVRFAEQLLSITPHFEDQFGLKDVLLDTCVTQPDITTGVSARAFQTDLTRCMTLIAILRKHCSLPLCGHALILRTAPNLMVQLKAQIVILEHERLDIPVLPQSPNYFNGEVLVCDHFNGLVLNLDECAILLGAYDNVGIELSIRIAIFKRLRTCGRNPDWSNILVPRINRAFRVTCQDICLSEPASLPSKILRSITETALSENVSAVHAIRTGQGGGNPQLLRSYDKAKGQRRDIDDEFHLHYWECLDGTIELVMVVHHNDNSIPE